MDSHYKSEFSACTYVIGEGNQIIHSILHYYSNVEVLIDLYLTDRPRNFHASFPPSVSHVHVSGNNCNATFDDEYTIYINYFDM